MSSIPRTSGIYKIVCSGNGKVYVGSAINLYRRWHGDHLYRLRKGNHSNAHLQHAWNKYGESTFSFEVIELASADDLIKREQYHIDCTKAHDNHFGMNISPSAYSRLGVRVSEETRRRMRDAKRGFRHKEETKRLFSEQRKGRPYSEKARVARSLSQKGRPLSQKVQLAQIEAESMRYMVIDPDGQEYEIKNLSKFCREHSLDKATAHRVACGKAPQHKGWRFRKLEEQ